MSDQDVTFGPGTDLVISLFAVSLLLIGALVSLYVESANKLISSEEQVDILETELEQKLDPSAVAADQVRMLERITVLTNTKRRLESDLSRLEKALAEEKQKLEQAFLQLEREQAEIDALSKDKTSLTAIWRWLEEKIKKLGNG